MKKIVFLLMLALAALIPTSDAIADTTGQNIYIYVDGEKVPFPDQKPYIDENSRTMVPVRFVSQAMGAKVDWTAKTQEVTVSDSAIGKTIKLWIGKETYTINGASKVMDTKAVLTAAGRTMVPLRFVNEALGCEVQYENIEGIGIIFNFTRNFAGNKEMIMENIRNQVRREALEQFRIVTQAEMKKGTEIEGVVTKPDRWNYWKEDLAPYVQLAEVSINDLPVEIPAYDFVTGKPMPLRIYDVKIDENYGEYDRLLKDNPGAVFVKANKRFYACLVCDDGILRGRSTAIPFDENGKVNPNYKNGTVTEFEIFLNSGPERSYVFFGPDDPDGLPKITKESLKWVIIYDTSYEVSDSRYSGIYVKNPYYTGN